MRNNRFQDRNSVQYSIAMDSVLSYHLDPSTCGVARFNTLLAQWLSVPMQNLFNWDTNTFRCPLISIKISEFSPEHIQALSDLFEARAERWRYRLFLHDFSNTEIELRMIRDADAVYCGNAELVSQLQGIRSDLVEAWCPGALVEERRFNQAEISVFSFGMAHKVRSMHYRKLRDLLELTGKSYCLYLSTALHDGTSFEEAFSAAYDELQQIFGDKIYFMGYLSDLAVYNYLKDTIFFAAFFDRGVRANNTSVNAAMRHGSVVITNLDNYSPGSFVHGNNIIDINKCTELPIDTDMLSRIGENAQDTARALNWDALVTKMKEC